MAQERRIGTAQAPPSVAAVLICSALAFDCLIGGRVCQKEIVAASLFSGLSLCGRRQTYTSCYSCCSPVRNFV